MSTRRDATHVSKLSRTHKLEQQMKPTTNESRTSINGFQNLTFKTSLRAVGDHVADVPLCESYERLVAQESINRDPTRVIKWKPQLKRRMTQAIRQLPREWCGCKFKTYGSVFVYAKEVCHCLSVCLSVCLCICLLVCLSV